MYQLAIRCASCSKSDITDKENAPRNIFHNQLRESAQASERIVLASQLLMRTDDGMDHLSSVIGLQVRPSLWVSFDTRSLQTGGARVEQWDPRAANACGRARSV